MPGVPYAAAKAALAGVTLTISEQLADRGIRVNAVNPGPVDTGYLNEDMWREVAPMFPLGRYGQPDDPARRTASVSSRHEAAGTFVGGVLRNPMNTGPRPH